MQTQKEIEKIIKQLEEYIVCDRDFGKLSKFPFYGEINTKLTTPEGIRKILLWVVEKQPLNCHRVGDR